MATMLMKNKALAQKTHQSSSVANQALKVGLQVCKALKSQPEKMEQSVDQHGVESIDG